MILFRNGMISYFCLSAVINLWTRRSQFTNVPFVGCLRPITYEAAAGSVGGLGKEAEHVFLISVSAAVHLRTKCCRERCTAVHLRTESCRVRCFWLQLSCSSCITLFKFLSLSFSSLICKMELFSKYNMVAQA